GREAVGDRLDELAQPALDRGILVLEDAPLRLRGGAQAVELGDELLGEDLEEGGVHETALEAVEHRRLEDVAADVLEVGAGAAIAGAGAAVEMLADDDVV